MVSRYMSNNKYRLPEGGGGGGGGQFYLGTRMNKIEYEEICTCPIIEISQDAANAGQKVK